MSLIKLTKNYPSNVIIKPLSKNRTSKEYLTQIKKKYIMDAEIIHSCKLVYVSLRVNEKHGKQK